MSRINSPNSTSRPITYDPKDVNAINVPGKQLDVPGNQLAQKSIKIRTSQFSIKVGADKLIGDINDGSYKKNYLSFWERFCAFFKELVDHNAGTKYLVSRIVGDDNKAAFAEALIWQLGKFSKSVEKEILNETFLKTINALNIDSVNESAKTSLAKAIVGRLSQTTSPREKENLTKALEPVVSKMRDDNKFNLAMDILDELCQMKDNSQKKDIFGKTFAFVLGKTSETTCCSYGITITDHLNEFIKKNQTNPNLVSIFGYVGGKCCDLSSPLKTTPLGSYLSYIDRACRGKGSKNVENFFEETLNIILSCRQDIIEKGLNDLKEGKRPSEDFSELLNDIFGHIKGEFKIKINKIGSNESFTFDIKQAYIDNIAVTYVKPNQQTIDENIKKLDKGEFPDEKFFGILNDFPQECFTTNIYDKELENQNFNLKKIVQKLRDFIIFKDATLLLKLSIDGCLRGALGIDSTALCDYLELRPKDDHSPFISKETWEQLSNNFNELIKSTVTEFFTEIEGNNNELNSDQQWKELKSKWESGESSSVFQYMVNNKICSSPAKKIFNKILQNRNFDLFKNVNLDINISDDNSYLWPVLVSSMLFLQKLYPRINYNDIIDCIGADEKGKFNDFFIEAYNQHMQKQLRNEVDHHNSDISDNSETSGATSPKNP